MTMTWQNWNLKIIWADYRQTESQHIHTQHSADSWMKEWQLFLLLLLDRMKPFGGTFWIQISVVVFLLVLLFLWWSLVKFILKLNCDVRTWSSLVEIFQEEKRKSSDAMTEAVLSKGNAGDLPRPHMRGGGGAKIMSPAFFKWLVIYTKTTDFHVKLLKHVPCQIPALLIIFVLLYVSKKMQDEQWVKPNLMHINTFMFP